MRMDISLRIATYPSICLNVKIVNRRIWKVALSAKDYK